MLSVAEARTKILAPFRPLSPETIPTENAFQRILAADIHASENLPPFTNSAMDGFAVRATELVDASQQSPQRLTISMDIPAGTQPDKPLPPQSAARIMTGAPLPEGADAVIPVEQTDADFSNPHLPPDVAFFSSATTGQNIRAAGENIHEGQLLLPAGRRLRPADIGMLAGLGIAQVGVIRQPRVAIVGSGDEIVDITDTPKPGQIRDMNSYTLAALVQDASGIPHRLPIAADTPAALRKLFADALALNPDLIVSSAGVSVGAADHVRAILNEMGSIEFWKINIRPGKPLAYGHINGIPFFGLPGNPVSAMVTFEVFVRPALLTLQGRDPAQNRLDATLTEPLESDGRETYARVTLHRDGSQLFATPTGTQSSGALLSLVLADGLLIIPAGTKTVAAGTTLTVQLLASNW